MQLMDKSPCLRKFLSGFAGFTILFFTTGCLITDLVSNDDDLYTRVWLVEDINGRGVIDFLQISFSVKTNGSVRGFAGCNSYFGSLIQKGERLDFGPVGSTKKSCGEAINRQEYNFLTTLSKVTWYKIEHGILYMMNMKGEILLRFGSEAGRRDRDDNGRSRVSAVGGVS